MKKFTDYQMTAIMRLTYDIAFADGRVDFRETGLTVFVFKKWGFSQEEANQIMDEAEFMVSNEAINIVSNLSPTGKKYVAAFLTVLMAIDGEQADKEVALLSLLTILCQLPVFETINEANDFLRA